MPYVDGYVLPLPLKNLAAYRKIAQKAGAIWREHGALEYRECVGEDLQQTFGTPFPKSVNAKKTETVIFAWIVYKNRAHRDKVNAKIMKDPRISSLCKEDQMPFDPKRMAYGGFKVIVAH